MQRSLRVALCASVVLVGDAAAAQAPLRSAVFPADSARSRTSSATSSQRSIVDTLTATLAKLELHETTVPAGMASHPPHRHAHEELLVVRTGVMEVLQGTVTRRAGPGSVVFMASNELHGLKNPGPGPVSYLVIRIDPHDLPPSAPSSTAPPASAAATALLGALTDVDQAVARFPFDTSERQNWFFVPTDRKGLTLGRMPAAARPLVDSLLLSGLSGTGLASAHAIMHHEGILGVLEAGDNAIPAASRRVRDSTKYYVSVFGKPNADSAWGWRVEGHHLSVNYTGVGRDTQVVAPLFMGANPARVPSGPSKGLRLFAAEEDLARALVLMLDDASRTAAIFADTAYEEIITRNDPRVKPLAREGLRVGTMAPAVRAQFRRLLDVYLARLAPSARAHAQRDIDDGGFDELRFAWGGSTKAGDAHYYRIHGPTILVEYDNRQTNANHVHTVWRDLRHDFGGDLLADHYKRHGHSAH